MKLFYGTKNIAKAEYMREILKNIGVDIISPADIKMDINDVDESGSNPLENACIKARAYYNALKIPVFSCDTGLFIEGLPIEKQPGVHVRRINNKKLSDDEMIEYYSGLAQKLGGQAVACYKNAICLIVNESEIYKYMDGDISSNKFIIKSKPHKKRIEGFPLDSLSCELGSNMYYFDIDVEKKYILEDDQSAGFRDFFLKSLCLGN